MSKLYDLAERRIAEQIQDLRPNWLVMWGVSSRRYWAFPLFNAERGTIVSAAGPEQLLTLMNQAEIAARPGDPRLRRPGD